MNYHTLLGFVLPTNEPDTFESYIKPSLMYVKDIADYTTILFNFQDPWDSDHIKEAEEYCRDLGFETRVTFNKYKVERKGYVPFNQIRYDAASLMPEAYIYALIDDDMTFKDRSPSIHQSSGEQYLSAIDYFLNNPKCGILMMGGTLIKKVKKYHISAVETTNSYITGRGYLLRNIGAEKGLIVPNEALKLYGAHEEKIAAAFRLFNGYFPAKLPFARTYHYENYRKSVVPGYDEYGWCDDDVVKENASKFIKESYNPKFKGKGYNDVVPYDTYLKNGGIDLYDKNATKGLELDMDFSDKSVDDIKSDIQLKGSFIE